MSNSTESFNKMFFSSYVGKKLNIEREKRNITFQEIGDKLNRTTPYISNVLGGKAPGHNQLFFSIGKALGLTSNEVEKIIAEAKIEELKHTNGIILGTNKKLSEMSVKELLEIQEEVTKALKEVSK